MPCGGIVTGIGSVHGRLVAIVANDATGGFHSCHLLLALVIKLPSMCGAAKCGCEHGRLVAIVANDATGELALVSC